MSWENLVSVSRAGVALDTETRATLAMTRTGRGRSARAGAPSAKGLDEGLDEEENRSFSSALEAEDGASLAVASFRPRNLQSCVCECSYFWWACRRSYRPCRSAVNGGVGS